MESGGKTSMRLSTVTALFAVNAATLGIAFAATNVRFDPEHDGSPGAGELFVGTNYQPVDRSREQIHRDIALMKQARFEVVRMGDLSWDYFEPAEGVFTFEEFDSIMDEMHENGIRVLLDIPGQPAPIWLHHNYPGVDLVDDRGNRLHPAERYMDNISDPDYRRLLREMADTLTERYASHPAVIAIGYNNEIGNGFMSWSEADRQRFIEWLKNRYGDLGTLNEVWATRRWSRRITGWDQVQLPYEHGPGPFERYLDLHRYWSDVTVGVLRELDAIRARNMPHKPVISNLWPGASRKGFDYQATYSDYADFGAFGYYAWDDIAGAFETMQMKAGLTTPVWFNEFQAGGGGYYGTPGWSRMRAHLGLLNGAQGVLAWTFNSHLGGEEQALFGLLDHDGTASWKLDEFAQIAKEFERFEDLGFPRKLDQQVAFAYSFDAAVAAAPESPSNTVKQYLTTSYMEQKLGAFGPIYEDNIDSAVIDVGVADLSPYKLVVVAGEYLLDEDAAGNLRQYVAKGGTVIMTAMSAKVNEHNQWFDTPLPGRLSDVFGLRTAEFYRGPTPLTGTLNGAEFSLDINFYEVLEPSTAEVRGRFTNVDGAPPAVTANHFGHGRAIYVATPAQPQIMRPLYRRLYPELGITPGPETPDGVFAREVEGRTLYVNTTDESVEIKRAKPGRGVISGRPLGKNFQLPALGVELVE